MIKLKYILQESMDKKELSLEEAVEIFKKNNKSYTGYRKHIFRGTRGLFADFAYVRPSTSERKSANTTNYYTLLMSNLPAWEKYPKRNRSMICSTNFHNAKSYGGEHDNLYHVFPKDGAKIGVCPENDIWWSFALPNKHRQDMQITNDYFEDIVRAYNELSGFDISAYEFTYDNLLQIFKFITENRKMFEYKLKEQNYVFWEWINAYPEMSFEKYINDIFLNPKFNRFQLVIYGPKFPELDYTHEVWTDADCLLVHEDSIKEFKKAVGLF